MLLRSLDSANDLRILETDWWNRLRIGSENLRVSDMSWIFNWRRRAKCQCSKCSTRFCFERYEHYRREMNGSDTDFRCCPGVKGPVENWVRLRVRVIIWCERICIAVDSWSSAVTFWLIHDYFLNVALKFRQRTRGRSLYLAVHRLDSTLVRPTITAEELADLLR